MFRAEEAKENFQLIYISLLIVRRNLINSILHPPEDYRPALLTPPSGSYKASNAANKSRSELGAGEAVPLGHLPLVLGWGRRMMAPTPDPQEKGPGTLLIVSDAREGSPGASALPPC